MDPIILATITSAVTTLALECGKGAASEAGKALWSKIVRVLGWQTVPPLADLSSSIARSLTASPKTATEVVKLLQGTNSGVEDVVALIGNLDADKVIISARITVRGDLNM